MPTNKTSQDILLETFETSKAHIKSYILRITANANDAEDIVQDTWIKASQNLASFNKDSSLKTWLFAIASNTAKDKMRAKKRWPVNVTDICKGAALKNQPFFAEAMHISMSSPFGQFEIKEHITFCFTCIGKSLPLEQHLCLLLKDVYDFKVTEIAIILDKTVAMVKYYLHTGRGKMIEIFDGRCALINKEGTCHQCTELNGIFNPKQNANEELAKLKLVKEANDKDKKHLYKLRMQVVKGIDPFLSKASELQLHHLEHNRKVMEDYLKKD